MPSGPEFGAQHVPGGNNPPVCPRHPDRVAFVRCQRCDRPVCPECQVPTEVGVICQDCAREAQARVPREHRRSAVGANPIATYVLIGLNVVLYGAQWISELISGSAPGNTTLTQALWFRGFDVSQLALSGDVNWMSFEPWRMLTSAFIHSMGSPLHLVMNMLVLWMLGRALEPVMGWARFLAVYLISAFGGSVAVLLLAPPNVPVLGASGAVYGLFAAVFILTKASGGSLSSITALIVINLVFSFTMPNVSWQGHLGGLIAGGLAAGALSLIQHQVPGAIAKPGRPSTPEGRRKGRRLEALALAGVIIILLAITWWGGMRIDAEFFIENALQ